ncbi:MAG: AAA family ATPase [Microbispora sp.]|nr:AAA family ATPase [Microbispora sp.]
MFEAWARLRPQVAGLHVVSDNAKPLLIRPASLRDPSKIPPRQWLYGTILVRRYITVLVAPGGVGKTAWSIAVGASLAAGKGLIGDWVHSRVNVLFCSLEDPEDEFDRRIAACMIKHRLDDEDLKGRVFTINGRDRRLTIAALDADGLTVCYPDKDALIAAIRQHNIGAVFVDPFVNSHELEENSNPHINAAARAWAEIAEATQCAVLLVHHTRKGAVAGDIDSGRGASALIGACRAGFTLTAMTPEEAKEFGIPEKERRLHIRLDDGKANLAPPSDKARWFRLSSIRLHNGNEDYPNGDSVQAVEEWEPPSVWKQLSDDDCNAALDAIQAGPGGGQKYTASRTGKAAAGRWAGRVLVEMFDLTEPQAAKVVNTWLHNGLLVEVEEYDPVQRKPRKGLAVDNTKRPGR